MFDSRGFTLIEVVLSIMIIGIIALFFLPMFNMGFSAVVKSGEKTDILYNLQHDLESSYKGNDRSGSDTLNIEFEDYGIVSVQGDKRSFFKDYDGSRVEINAFVPANSVDKSQGPVTGITLSAGSIQISVGESDMLSATLWPQGVDMGIRWQSSNESVAVVNGGLIQAISPGSTVIRATTDDGTKWADCQVTVVGSFEQSDATLSSIEIDGPYIDMTPSFSPGIFAYDVTTYGNSVPDIRVSTSSSLATYTIDKASKANGNIKHRTTTITVTSADRQVTRIYKIVFTRN